MFAATKAARLDPVEALRYESSGSVPIVLLGHYQSSRSLTDHVNYIANRQLWLGGFALRHFCLIIVAAALASAQTTSTSIVGNITDSSGASVSGAKVAARNVRTSVTSETLTTDTGDYAFPLLDVGEYQVSVESRDSSPKPARASCFK